MGRVQTGLERLLTRQALQEKFSGKKLGLLSNQASTDNAFNYAKDVLRDIFGEQLTCLFSPQHGFFSEKQDNMIESDHHRDLTTGLPIFSLYSKTRKPTSQMYDYLDVLLVDLVDVGTRVYTFMYTMAYCLEAAAEYNKKVVILDRPNPVGGNQVEGNLLDLQFKSFVGLYPIPMRHGMTFGELARYINEQAGIGADLEIIEMDGWQRHMYFEDTGLSWVAPSPNMPAVETAVVYPGQVLWEGTNISEGRGTCKPFEMFGAPFWDHGDILDVVSQNELPGCYIRPLVFQPTSGKWAGEVCSGFHLHVTAREAFQPYKTSLAFLQANLMLYREKFMYASPPYEYEFEKMPIDLILGDQGLRCDLENGVALDQIEEDWQEGLNQFKNIRTNYLIY